MNKYNLFCLIIPFIFFSCSDYQKDIEPFAEADSEMREWLNEYRKIDNAAKDANNKYNFENWESDSTKLRASSKETQELFMHWKIEKYQDKYVFGEIKDPTSLDPEIYSIYEIWDERRQPLLRAGKKYLMIMDFSEAYSLWYLSIIIGILFMLLIRGYKAIEKKWLKYLVIFILISFLWLGTSCYSYLFLFKHNLSSIQNESYELSFLTITTQLRFFSFVIMWLLNSGFILLLIILTRRLLDNLGIFIVEIFKSLGLMSYEDFRSLKDKIILNLTVYIVFCSILFYFYLNDNPIMEYLLIFRSNLSNNFFYEFGDGWLLVLISTFIIVSTFSYYWWMALQSLREMENERDES